LAWRLGDCLIGVVIGRDKDGSNNNRVDYFGIHKKSKPRTKEKGVYVGKVIYLKVVSKW
jgi:hypothetical protein